MSFIHHIEFVWTLSSLQFLSIFQLLLILFSFLPATSLHHLEFLCLYSVPISFHLQLFLILFYLMFIFSSFFFSSLVVPDTVLFYVYNQFLFLRSISLSRDSSHFLSHLDTFFVCPFRPSVPLSPLSSFLFSIFWNRISRSVTIDLDFFKSRIYEMHRRRTDQKLPHLPKGCFDNILILII